MLNHRALLLVAALVGGFLLALIGHARSHDVYSDWKQPGSNMPCCSGPSGEEEKGDCYPTEAKFENGQWYALRREDQRWLAVPDRAVLKDGATPDGKAHLCAPAPITEEDIRIYCFRPGWSGG